MDDALDMLYDSDDSEPKLIPPKVTVKMKIKSKLRSLFGKS